MFIFIFLFYLCFDNGFINARLFLFSFFICVPTTVLLTLAYFYSSFLYVVRRRFCQRSLISILLLYMCSDDGSANARLSLFFFFIYVPTMVLPTLAYLYPLFLYVFWRWFCQRSHISILFFYLCSGDGSVNARLSLSSFLVRVSTTILLTLAYLYSLFLSMFRQRFRQPWSESSFFIWVLMMVLSAINFILFFMYISVTPLLILFYPNSFFFCLYLF